MSATSVAGACVIICDVFRLPHWFRRTESPDYQVSADIRLTLMDELMRLGRRTTRWFLRSRRNEPDAARGVAHFGSRTTTLSLKLNELLGGPIHELW